MAWIRYIFSLFGTWVAAPIAKNVLQDSITALEIEKRDGGIEKEYRYFDVKYVTVPDVVGKTIKEAKPLLKNFSIEYSGKGENIVSTSPEAGSSIPINSTIRLMLN